MTNGATASEWIDISVPLRNGMAHWPGDLPFERSLTLSIGNGDACNLSQFSASAHIGTHMDAPRHFIDGAATIETLPLDAVIGPARVIGIRDEERIPVEELEPHRIVRGERLLFKTANSGRVWSTSEFQKKYVYIPGDTAQYLAARGVRTIGVDYLSVGAFAGDGPEVHRALLGAGIWIIEGLNLEFVEPGDYEMICLPLKMIGSDGSPARAVVRSRKGAQ
jgi:arylformamidase